ncbi:hypothetical protein [uncultured Serinicoccus sp.]|uniref:hypothetical protein n=1 Tax=uncultured Serinicoccus sp. TaxID=735514 RepID=UPI002601A8CD|nr:hypothetical protein [uncultured Serinicoccus sp.]
MSEIDTGADQMPPVEPTEPVTEHDDPVVDVDDGTAPAGENDYGFYGDGPQQGTLELADDVDGLYADGPQQGVVTPDQPGTLFSDDPFGSRTP